MIKTATDRVIDLADAGLARLSLGERLSLLGLLDEGMRQDTLDAPGLPDLFGDVSELLEETTAGAKIDSLKPGQGLNAFQVFEIKAESGENLGRLNMLYLKKPLPCYYLVYVEVAAPFRRKGLGGMVLKYYRDFLTQKSALGLLDNIIPPDDPTYDIYLKQDWRPIENILGREAEGNYMIFVPPRLTDRDLKGSLLKLLHHLQRKRPAIEMRDNEAMVRQTIQEFMDLKAALLTYFRQEIEAGQTTPLMRFMFTRFVTKLMAFRRKIGDLLGFTGGESLEQIEFPPQVLALPIQSYAPKGLTGRPAFENGQLPSPALPEDLMTNPAREIEALPNYRRPNYKAWLASTGRTEDGPLTIGDLLDLGFDPTRLKEITLEGQAYIFERLAARRLPELRRKKEVLAKASEKLAGLKAKNARVDANPPLLAIRDRGNAYVLRRKVPGIHWEEAVEQVQMAPGLVKLNEHLKLDRLIQATVRIATEYSASRLDLSEKEITDNFAWFISWDLATNQPKLTIDFTSTSLETVWLA